MGTVIVVEEDLSGNYSRLLLKYFLSAGLADNHSLLVTNSSPDGKVVTSSLPMFNCKEEGEKENLTETGAAETMKIAWRYQNQNTTKSSNLGTSQRTRHSFNLLKTIPPEMLKNSDVQICDIEPPENDDSWRNSSYHKLIKEIESKVQSGGFNIDPNVPKEHKNILRLGIQSLGCSNWGELQETAERNLGTFLLCLRSILRSCFGIAFLTVPSHVLRQVQRERELTKYFLEITSH